MALRLLGEAPIDIHAGGVDLIFPHHENEIAQSEGATGQSFSRFWVHVEHLFVEHEKMSKSIGNVHTVPDVVAKGHRPSALRYLLLSSHYRKQLNFTWAGMDQAEESLRRIVDFLARLEDVRGDATHGDAAAMVTRAREAFRKALESDLNTAAALAAVFDLVSEGNTAIDAKRVGAADAALIREAIEECDRVLGVVSLRRAEDAAVPDELVREIERLVEARRDAKQRRDFAAADQIRKTLAERGILLEDSPTGTRWKKK
jgi:cysteinyl-tRNA synthetase